MSSPWRKREVLNATEYAVMMNEAAINDGNAPVYADPYSFGEGTDWQDELFNWNAEADENLLSLPDTEEDSVNALEASSAAVGDGPAQDANASAQGTSVQP